MNNFLTRRKLFGLAPVAAMAMPVSSSGNSPGEAKWNVRSYGARGNGIDLDTRAINRAIEDCATSGGGTVFFPAGTYLSGTVILRDRVSLELDAGAVLLGSKDLQDYPSHIAKFSSYTDTYTERSLILAEGAQNIGIRGSGTIDGQGAAFRGTYKRRPFVIRFISCQNVSVTGITIKNSAMWVQHYLDCDNVAISGVTVNSRVNLNNDGVDIDCCQRVRISDCDIISGDDAIVLKSTASRPCKDVVINNCVVSSLCNGLKVGTESVGGFENIAISNCAVYGTRLGGIVVEMVDGGDLNRVSISNIVMREVGAPIFIRLGDRARAWPESSPRPSVGRLRNISIENVQATATTNTGCVIAGLPAHPLEHVTLSDIRLTFPGGGSRADAERKLTESSERYPEFNMFGMLPAYGLYCWHGTDFLLRNIHTDFLQPEERPAIICQDLDGVTLTGAVLAHASASEPSICLIQVKRALVQGCRAHGRLHTWLEVKGRESEHISIIGNDFANAELAISVGDGVAPNVVFLAANRT